MGGWKQLGEIPKVGKTYELDFETKLLNLDNPVTHVFLAIKKRGSSGTQWGARIPAVYSDNDKAKWKVCTYCHLPRGRRMPNKVGSRFRSVTHKRNRGRLHNLVPGYAWLRKSVTQPGSRLRRVTLTCQKDA